MCRPGKVIYPPPDYAADSPLFGFKRFVIANERCICYFFIFRNIFFEYELHSVSEVYTVYVALGKSPELIAEGF